MEPDRTAITAFHEAAHVVVAHVLGDTVAGASIRPGRQHLGVAAHYAGHLPGPEALDAVGQPLPLQPASIRRHVEVAAIISAAGVEGELLARTDPTPPPPDPDRPAVTLTPVSDQVRRSWRSLDADDGPTLMSDAERALDACWLICPDWHTRDALVALCEAVARDLVRTHADAVARVARALLQHRELSGDDLIPLIEGPTDATPQAS